MFDNNYGKREIDIFNAVIKLMNEGVDLHSVKAADIAEAAGIGKGTLYNYFKSKEEILAKAIIYNIEIQFNEVFSIVNKAQGFKNKCYGLFKLIEENSRSKNSNFILALSSIETDKLRQYLEEGNQIFIKRKEEMSNAVRRLMEVGIDEGIVKAQENREYEYHVFISAMLGYSNYFCSTSNLATMDIEKIKENAYTLILKSLS
ncbi:MAG TPA: hypothetical protein DIT16_02275 [Clostridium sp.]|nr:hypothetical protein [Clostridium sp.]